MLYLLGQLQSKPVAQEKLKEPQEEVSKREHELMQRLKFQVWMSPYFYEQNTRLVWRAKLLKIKSCLFDLVYH